MSPPRLDELERLVDGLPRRLTRSSGFVLILIVAPSRGALRHARTRCEAMVTSAGRAFVVGLPKEAPKGPSPMVWVAGEEPGWRARAETLVRVNIARDALHLAGCGIILGLLDVDYPRFGALAPDLWSVRTAVFRHDQADPLPAMPRVAKGAGAPHTDAPVPPELEALARTLPLRALRVRERDGDKRTLTLDNLYVPLEVFRDGAPAEGALTLGPVEVLLGAERLAVIEAPAGAGKSTALRRAARDWARAGESVLWAPGKRLTTRVWGDELLDDLTALQSVCPWPVAQERAPTVVLDGLDELGALELRATLALALADLALIGLVERVALCARPGALGVGRPEHPGEAVEPRTLDVFTRLRLLPFSAEQMRTYVKCWAEATELAEAPREALTLSLENALGLGASASRLAARRRALCDRPLFLAVLCALVWGSGAQHERESELLDALVTASINPHFNSGLRAGDLRWLAGKVAWAMHTSKKATLPAYSLVEGDDPLLSPEELAALRLHTGLLIESGAEVSFSHLALQELLAAERAWDCVEWWKDDELTVFLWEDRFAQWLAWDEQLSGIARLFLESVGERTPARMNQYLRRLGLAPVQLTVLLTAAWPVRPPLALRALWQDTTEALLKAHQSQSDADQNRVRQRSLIGRSLAALGDDRIGRLEWRDVGDGWQVARWPVTRGQYLAFMEDGGYTDDSLWSEAGRHWRSSPSWSQKKDRPVGWVWVGLESSPISVWGLSRHEAEAFVRWSQRLDPRVCVPTETVWRRAAQGAPHFDVVPEWVKEAAAFNQTAGCVGSLPELASATGVEDLGLLGRELLASDSSGDAIEKWAGRPISEAPIPLKDCIGFTTTKTSRHNPLVCLRLARRPPNR